jgi:hypothetical protein
MDVLESQNGFAELGMTHIESRRADLEDLPFGDKSFAAYVKRLRHFLGSRI